MLLCQIGFGQGKMTKLMQRIVEDKSRLGIDSVVVYFAYSAYYTYYGYPVDSSLSESAQYEKNCDAPDAIYILYRLNGENYVQKMGDCYSSKPVLLIHAKAVPFLLQNINNIKQETIQNFKVENSSENFIKDDELDRRTALYFSLHTQTKSAYWYDLDLAETSNIGESNRYAKQNNQTKTIEFANLIKQDIKDIVFVKNLSNE